MGFFLTSFIASIGKGFANCALADRRSPGISVADSRFQKHGLLRFHAVRLEDIDPVLREDFLKVAVQVRAPAEPSDKYNSLSIPVNLLHLIMS